MQITLVAPLCVTLLLSLANAPFFHVHQRHTHHHEGPGTHTHLPSRPSSETAGIDATDEDADAKELNWFQFEQPRPQLLPIVLIDSSSLTIPQVVTVPANRELPRIHDPPFENSAHPRAPPA